MLCLKDLILRQKKKKQHMINNKQFFLKPEQFQLRATTMAMSIDSPFLLTKSMQHHV